MELTWNAILRVFSPSFVPSKLTSNCWPYRFLRLVKCLKTWQGKEQPLITIEASNTDSGNGSISCNGSGSSCESGAGVVAVELVVAVERFSKQHMTPVDNNWERFCSHIHTYSKTAIRYNFPCNDDSFTCQMRAMRLQILWRVWPCEIQPVLR